jgi:hypothetical protein
VKSLADEADGGRSEKGVATVYQKHRSVQSRQVEVYGLTPARCWKVKRRRLASAKLRIEAPVNGGRNYNGPKVAKFLVG